MRSAGSITLIVVGGLLILTPLVVNYFEQAQHQANAVKVVENTNLTYENKLFYMRDRYPMGIYAYICLAAGVAMAGLGIREVLRKPPAGGAEPGAAPDPARM